MASQVSRFGGGGSAAHRPAGKQGKSGKTHKTERHGAKSKKTGLQSVARVEGRSQSGRWRGHEDTDAQRRLPLPEVVAVWGGEQARPIRSAGEREQGQKCIAAPARRKKSDSAKNLSIYAAV